MPIYSKFMKNFALLMHKPAYAFYLRLSAMVLPGLLIVFILKYIPALKFSVLYSKPIYFAYKSLLLISKSVLSFLGINVSLIYTDKIYYYPVYALQTTGGDILFLGISCLGILLMLIYAVLIIAYPGNFRTKLWVIPVGCLIIQILNIIRIVFLTFLIDQYQININKGFTVGGILLSHHDIFNILILLVVFFMFRIYIQRLSPKGVSVPSEP